MAVAVLFTASCAKEDISSSIGGGEVEMTFTVDLPELGTRAYADGAKATTLRYYVYEGDNYLRGISSETLGTTTLTNGKAVVTLPLLKGMTYNIIFWADNGSDIYSIDPATKVLTVDYTGVMSNDDSRDAFYKYLTNVDPTATDIKEKATVILTRPFGQLNAATSDFEAVKNNGVTLTTSALVAIKANTTLNLATGIAGTQDEITFAEAAMPCTLTPNKETLKSGYEYLSMNYLLPGTVDAVYTFKGKRSDNSEVEFTGTTYTNVPVKANYRTNILGKLLTASTDFTVEIEADFYEPAEVVAADTEALQAALDSATEGDVIYLKSNVNYGVVYLGRPTADNNTVMYCETHDFSTTDAEEFKAHLGDGAYHTTPRYTTTLKNVTIVGATGATVAGLVATSGHMYGSEVYDYVLDVKKSGSGYYNTLNMENITFSKIAFTGKIDINTSDATSVYNGVTFNNCTFTTGGTVSSNGAAIRYYNEANNGNVKNIVVNKCTFNNCYQGVYTGSVNGVTVTECTFNTTGHNAIAVQSNGVVDLKNVVISGNSFDNIADRIIRFNEIGADSNITITNNTATDSGDDAGEVIKATSIAAGITTYIGNNNWGTGAVVVNPELRDNTVYATADSVKAALAQVVDGVTILLEAGTYDDLSFTNPANYKAKNVTIVGKDGVNIAGFSINGWSATNNIEINGLTFKNVTFTSGLLLSTKVMANVTVENCDFVNDACVHQNDNTEKLTNLVIKDCTFAGDINGNKTAVMLENTENVTISGCTFTDIDFNVLQSGVLTGNVLVDNNTVNGTGDRVFRFVNTSNVNITISNNTITSNGDGNGELAKASNPTKIKLRNNTWNGKSDAEVADKLININITTNVANADELTDALKNSGTVVLSQNVEAEAATAAPYGNKYGFKLDGGVLDGNDKELKVECYGDDYGIMTSGGTVKNLTIKEGCRAIMIMHPTEDIILDNVNFGGNGVLYPINTGEAGAEGIKLVVTNSTLAGWVSFSNIASASFTNVKFEHGTYYNNIYGRVLKPYVNTTITDCSFIAHMNLDLSKLTSGHKITFKNCTVDGQAVDASVFTVPTTDAQYDTELFTVDLPSWASSINDCIVFE